MSGQRDIRSRWEEDELWLRGEKLDEIVEVWPEGTGEGGTWVVGEDEGVGRRR